jgi:Flp pilus assembly protein protease CpaA
MLEFMVFSVALVLLIIGTITDIKTREVPDWLNFAGISAGFGINALWALHAHDWQPIMSSALGFGVFFVIACVMYYTGQWGGGDSKLLMALGALLGFGFSLSNPAVAFLIWVLLAGAAYGLCWSAWYAAKNFRVVLVRYRKLLEPFRWAHALVLGVFALGIAFAIATNDDYLRIVMLVLALLAPALFYTSLFIKAVELCCMYKQRTPAELTEGDWIAKPVSVKGRYICGPKDLGITQEKIKRLKKLKVKQVTVKEGIPFVPSFLIGFLLSIWLGSPLHRLF